MAQVYLFRGNHPLYETLVSNPPDGIEYVQKGTSGSRQEYTLYNASNAMVRQTVNQAFALIGVPRWFPILKRYDLVHSCRGFFILGPNPYVVDVEHCASFAGFQYERLTSNRFRRLVEKGLLSDKCRAVLPHCEAAKKTLSLVTESSSVHEKTTVLYPTIVPERYAVDRKEEDSPRLLFMGEYYWKGGREFLEACSRLKDRLDFKVKYISLRVHPPEEILSRAREQLQMEYVEGPIPRAELFSRTYPSSDVFVMPTYIDTFGYAFLEAMSFGLPCIGTRHFAVPEIVEDNVTGLLVEPVASYFDAKGIGHPGVRVENIRNQTTVDGLTDALEKLISSRSLRSSMGRAGYNLVAEGKFCVKRRNDILKSVYESAIHGRLEIARSHKQVH